MTASSSPQPGTAVDITPIDGPLGAVVTGVELDETLATVTPGDSLTRALIDGLDRHRLLVVRDAPVSPAQLVTLGQAFGPVIVPSINTLPKHPEVVRLANVGANDQFVAPDHPAAVALRHIEQWRSEYSFHATPASYTLLTAVEVPQRGGQTQFADMTAAVRILPPEQLVEIQDLSLVHRGDDSSTEVEHPWVRSLPDGGRALYMGAHAAHIVGRGETESRQRFAEIEAQLSVHDLVYEHRWRPGDLLVWDNRAVLHRTLPFDIANDRRVMHSVSVRSAERPTRARSAG